MMHYQTIFKFFVQACIISSFKIHVSSMTGRSPPNIVIFISDDLGIGDVGCFGNDTLHTPNIDRIYENGMKLNHNLAGESVCSPSRAALLTGRYATRLGFTAFNPSEQRVVTYTSASSGLPLDESNFAQVLKTNNYTNGYFGKWHLGLHCDKKDFCHFPLKRGFDYYFGMPLTNLLDCDFAVGGEAVAGPVLRFPKVDVFLPAIISTLVIMFTPYFPFKKLVLLLLCVYITLWGYHIMDLLVYRQLNCFVMKNYDLVEQPVQLKTLTDRLTAEVGNFIENNSDRPFMTIVAYHKVHTALTTNQEFEGVSKHGKYGDNVEEMDSSVGKILKTLETLELLNNTFVYFTSDHGPALYMTVDNEMHGGSKGIFKGGKGSSWEGGIRVPTIAMMPGVIPARRSYNKPTSGLDLFPTVLSLAGVSIPSEKSLDGRDISSILKGDDILEERFLFHYCGSRIQAVTYAPKRSEKVWKLHLEIQQWINRTESCKEICPCFGDRVVVLDEPLLFELKSDASEESPVDTKSLQYQTVYPVIKNAVLTHKHGVVPVEGQFDPSKNCFSLDRQMCCGSFPFCNC